MAHASAKCIEIDKVWYLRLVHEIATDHAVTGHAAELQKQLERDIAAVTALRLLLSHHPEVKKDLREVRPYQCVSCGI